MTDNKRLSALVLTLLLCLSMLAQVPKRPNPPRLVNDMANVMINDAVLEDTLESFAHSTSNQICVVTLHDLQGYQPAEMAYKIGQEWGVGDKRFNNGVVILIKPKTPTSGGKVFIATGYGVEGALPDALCRRIIENKLIPAFRTGDYEAGVWDALAVMMPILKGEYDAEEYMEQEDEMGAEDIIAIVFFLAIFLYILYWSSHGGGTGTGTGGRNTGTWGGPPIIFTGGSDWGGSSRSGGFGGGFGGGWGGFGGGSFGGGGAGGSW